MRLNLQNIYHYLIEETPHKVDYEQVLTSLINLQELFRYFRNCFQECLLRLHFHQEILVQLYYSIQVIESIFYLNH